MEQVQILIVLEFVMEQLQLRLPEEHYLTRILGVMVRIQQRLADCVLVVIPIQSKIKTAVKYCTPQPLRNLLY